MPKVLMVAFHYPPYEGGSGIHRTLKFTRYLPTCGWLPIVLTAHPRAYAQTGNHQLEEIPPKVIVNRAFVLDAARHLSVRGAYLRIMALPDQWSSWWIGAVWEGMNLVQRHKPEVIWSTYPIATAHLIGFTLQRLTGIPWVGDFRDPMTEEEYPRDPWVWRCYRWIEQKVVKHAKRSVFTTESTKQMYLQRYPGLSPDRCIVIPNGYDEEDFKGLTWNAEKRSLNGRSIRLLHAGVIYPDERDPRAFFRTLARLKSDAKISANTLQIDLRASGSESHYSSLLTELAITDIVRLLPSLPHSRALEDCVGADGLLLFQAASCNHQIPAKVYEYLRIGKPIFALTPNDGDTGRLLQQIGGATIVDLVDEPGQYERLLDFISAIRNGKGHPPNADKIRLYARQHQALELAKCLSESASAAKLVIP